MNQAVMRGSDSNEEEEPQEFRGDHIVYRRQRRFKDNRYHLAMVGLLSEWHQM